MPKNKNPDYVIADYRNDIDDSSSVTVKRFDNGEFTFMDKTDEGFLKGMARVTRTGIFDYRNADGGIRRELRHPDDVFNLDSLNTLRMIPVTNEHPPERLVTADTAKSLSIGYTGESFKPDGQFVMIPVVITDKMSIEQIESGKNELSLGYEVELDDVAGTYDGQNYDCRQKKIKYNHLAVVDRGRAGPDVRLNVDEAEEIFTDINNDVSLNQRGGNMPKLRLDNDCVYEVPQEVVAEFDKLRTFQKSLQSNLDTAKADVEKQRADADTAKETNAKLQKRIDELDKEIAAGVQNRIALERVANGILGDEVKLDSLSESEIKNKVILKYFPDAKLDGQPEAYITARYDAAIELHKKGDESSNSAAQQRQTVNHDTANSSSVRTADKARNDMIEHMKNQYKSK